MELDLQPKVGDHETAKAGVRDVTVEKELAPDLGAKKVTVNSNKFWYRNCNAS
jgi:hypothetical protein